MREWVRIGLEPRVVRRALKYALIVGPVLVGINHGYAILCGTCGSDRLLSIGLTLTVPYLVSTLSSVGAMRQSCRSEAGPGSAGDA